MSRRLVCARVALVYVFTWLVACGGGSAGDSATPANGGTHAANWTVQGSVQGLQKGDDISVTDGSSAAQVDANGSFVLATSTPAQSNLKLSVTAQTTSGETCTLSIANSTTFNTTSSLILQSGQSPDVVVTCQKYPAATPHFPILTSPVAPARVISAPILIPVFFSDVTARTDEVAFLETLATSTEWQALAQYNVHTATVGRAVQLTTPSPATMTEADVQTFVGANASGWATLTGNEIFILFYPPTTKFTDLGPFVGAYHASTSVQGVAAPVAYAVIPNYASLTGSAPNPAYSQFHELAEAATDPSSAGYASLSDNELAWNSVSNLGIGGTEVADLCENAFYYASADLMTGGSAPSMKPLWSNANVQAGRDPCPEPSTTQSAFGGFPVLPDSYTVGTDTNAAVRIAPGASRTIPVELFSFGPLPSVLSVSAKQVGGSGLSFSFDKTTGSNGDTVNLTITAPATALSGAKPYAIFSILVSIGQGGQTQWGYTFPGLVTN